MVVLVQAYTSKRTPAVTRTFTSQVYVLVSIKSATGQVLSTTRPEEEGSGVPFAFVLGKGKRAPRGWELACQGDSLAA